MCVSSNFKDVALLKVYKVNIAMKANMTAVLVDP